MACRMQTKAESARYITSLNERRERTIYDRVNSEYPIQTGRFLQE